MDRSTAAHPALLAHPQVHPQRQALIFGGFDMQPKHCRGISDLYRQHGVQSVTPLCHSLQQMTVVRLGDQQARRLAQRFANLTAEDAVAVHLYSGSVFIFFRLLSHLPIAARRAIRTVVFECSPMDCQAEQFGRFASWRLGRDYRRRHAAPFVLLRPLAGITRRFEREHHAAMRLLDVDTAVHFILCEDDPIIDPGYVTAYHRDLLHKGHASSLTLHRNARHCRALSDCPEPYQADLAQFLDRHWLSPQPEQPGQHSLRQPAIAAL